MDRKRLYIYSFLKYIGIYVLWMLGFGILWCLRTWQHLSMDELVYELSSPLRGTGGGMIEAFVINSILPAIIIVLITVVTKAKFHKSIRVAAILGSAFFVLCAAIFYSKLGVGSYISDMNTFSTFVEDNYVDPKKVSLTFPEKKRNLIYIFLESIETTYTDVDNGGGFEYDCIPELTQLAHVNGCFSGVTRINGGLVYPGTSWTMGGMFAQSSGLPLKIDIGENLMSTQKTFFPGVTCIGDILKEEGYNQELLLGSDVVFGGRKVFYDNHGEYDIRDYNYMLSSGRLPEGYQVWWGFEDKKLFDYAKEDLIELAHKDEPFNLTMLTVDTHFEDGYICDLCESEYGDNQYANVMACASKQVHNFVKWISEQDFYENTTIVICGDHTTMDSDFCNDVPDDYSRRTYTAIINPAVSKLRDDMISYSTMDMFPTTLAALGVEIEGDRLGLGTNLFSNKQTLTEKFGEKEVADQLNRKSEFINLLSGLDYQDKGILRMEGRIPDGDINVVAYDSDKDIITVKADDIINVPGLDKVYVKLFSENGRKLKKIELDMKPDRSYSGDIKLKQLKNDSGTIKVYAHGNDGDVQIGEMSGNLTYQAHDNMLDYISLLKERDNIAILVASKLENMSRASGEIFTALRSLGITLDLSQNLQDMQSFYAVIDGSGVAQEFHETYIEGEGILDGDNSEYSIISTAWPDCKIVINEKDYSPNEKGINFVIYDYTNHEVVDTASFNVSHDKVIMPSCSVDAELKTDSAIISLTDFDAESENDLKEDSGRGLLWSGRTYKSPIEFSFRYDSGKLISDTLDLTGLDVGDCYLDVFLKSGKTNVEKKLVKWHGNLNFLKSDLNDYLSEAKKYEGKIVLISAKDISHVSYDDNITKALISVGLDLDGYMPKQALSAILSKDSTKVELSESRAKTGGEIDGVLYETISQCGKNGSGYGAYASIMINGIDYAINNKGINIVIYDMDKGHIEDRVVFIDAKSGRRPYYYNTPIDTARFYYDLPGETDIFFNN